MSMRRATTISSPGARRTARLRSSAATRHSCSAHPVTSPASSIPRRNYWTHDLSTDDADAWLAHATSHAGSWWPHWSAWVAAYAGARRAAPVAAGSERYPPLSPAPGTYVLAAAD